MIGVLGELTCRLCSNGELGGLRIIIRLTLAKTARFATDDSWRSQDHGNPATQHRKAHEYDGRTACGLFRILLANRARFATLGTVLKTDGRSFPSSQLGLKFGVAKLKYNSRFTTLIGRGPGVFALATRLLTSVVGRQQVGLIINVFD